MVSSIQVLPKKSLSKTLRKDWVFCLMDNTSRLNETGARDALTLRRFPWMLCGIWLKLETSANFKKNICIITFEEACSQLRKYKLRQKLVLWKLVSGGILSGLFFEKTWFFLNFRLRVEIFAKQCPRNWFLRVQKDILLWKLFFALPKKN